VAGCSCFDPESEDDEVLLVAVEFSDAWEIRRWIQPVSATVLASVAAGVS
jgi:hypothetical protein